MKIHKRNLYHIKRVFEEKTGAALLRDSDAKPSWDKELTPEEPHSSRKWIPKIAVIAAVITCFVTLAAFGVSIFSTLGGDRLVMTASYAGRGIVWVEITNQSEKTLNLEPVMKLYYHSTQKPVPAIGEAPYLSSLSIAGNSTQKIRLDLRKTYDVESLENKKDIYYLQLTNDSFLTGQKWTCTVSFTVSDYVTPYYELSDDRHLQGVLPSLQAYYYNFTPDIFARWPDAFDYMELVEAEIAKAGGNLVRPTDDSRIGWDSYDWMATRFPSCFDAYNKLMGRDDTEKFSPISVQVPCLRNDGAFSGGWNVPVFFPYVYAVQDIQSPQDYAFVRGNLLTFAEMEPYKIYEDEQYLIYEMHEFFYTDLRTYVEDLLLQRDDMYFNDDIWKRIEDFYNYFNGNPELGERFKYLPIRKREPMSIDTVIELSRLGNALTAEDLKPYFGGHHEAGYQYGAGLSATIDDDYEFFYSKKIDGTPIGFYLIHTPTGDRIEIGKEDVDVPAFVAAHGEPEPRCQCENTESGHHGWRITLEWVIEKGKDIDVSDSSGCCHIYVGEDPDDPYYHREVIDDEFFLTDQWDEEKRDWVCVLVHEPTGDECWLKDEDVQAFITEHQK